MDSERSPTDPPETYRRRRVLSAGALAALSALGGCVRPVPEHTDPPRPSPPADAPPPVTDPPRSETRPQMDDHDLPQSQTFAIEPHLDLGGRLIVAGPDELGYDTITAAYDDAESGDRVFVHSTYDARAAGEPFPIVLDQERKEVMLTGGHPSGSVIDASHTDENVIEIYGRGFNDYRNKATVQHLKLVGGDVGLTVQAAPYSTYRDLVCYDNGSHGVQVSPYVDENGDAKGSFGVTFHSCVAWACRGAGFKLHPEANPHSTTFYGCHAMYNGLDSDGANQPGVQLRGFASRWHGGTVQGNGGFGIDARAGSSQRITGTYFEGNGRVDRAPHDVYVGRGADALTLHGAYFQGNYGSTPENGRDREYRAVALDGVTAADLKHCTYRNYEAAFVTASDTTDVDLNLHSHVALDDTATLDLGENERLRSNGLILETDLREEVTGAFVGDRALHDGSGRLPWGPAMWNGDRWVSVVNGRST